MGVAKNKNHFKNNNYFIFIPKINKIEPIEVDLNIKFEELLEISSQKEIVLKNTQNFLKDQPSNNILLWGAKGMGKSTLIKCVVDYVNVKIKSDKMSMLCKPSVVEEKRKSLAQAQLLKRLRCIRIRL